MADDKKADDKKKDDNRIKILVVDDEKMLLKAFSQLMLIKRDKYKAGFFTKPKEAIEEVKSHPDRYHVILTDINMPDMDGIQFVETIRSLPCTLPIVFMTGFNSPEIQERIKKLDKVVLLEKPFQLQNIMEEVIRPLVEKDRAAS